MLRTRVFTLAAALALAALAVGAGPARAALVTAGSGSGLAGDNVDIAISTADLTGLGVVSLQFSLSYNNTVVTAVNVLTTGTLPSAAGWTAPAWNVTNVAGTGKIMVSDAGTAPLAGAGTLVIVRFTINPALINGGGSALTLSNVLFNEGTPPATTTNGTLTVNATPQINVSPDNGEIVRGQTLQFLVSGSVTNPMSWTTTDPLVATISPAGLLTGVAPGAVRVTGTDAALHSSQTTGDILIRGMGLTAGAGVAPENQSVSVPITVTSLAGLGIRSGQFRLSWTGSFVAATGVSAPPGTLLNGWGTPVLGASPNFCTVDFAGTSDLGGSGVLCYVQFSGLPDKTGNSTLTVSDAIFNETLPAKTTNGNIQLTTLPPIYVYPDQVTLLAGATQQMTLGGTPTPPVTWSVLDPLVASIDGSGLLTALHGGVTQVRAEDALGSADLNTMLRVYDLRATLGTVTGAPGTTVRVPLTSDRLVGSLGIWSEQMTLSWAGAALTAARPVSSALWSEWGFGSLAWSSTPNSITAAAAGTATLDDAGTTLAAFEFDISPSATPGTNVALTLSGLTCNEGDPSPQLANGVIQVRNTTDAGPAQVAFALGAPVPNPARGSTRVPFTLPSPAGYGSPVRLEVFDLGGARIRTLVNGALPAGAHEARWDVRDDLGRAVGPGLYFLRLEAAGRSLTRKVGVVR
ncbi:MAG: Ig-like domain-containing protein [Candidatus Eisenbacteria bacterium]|nr:Ig-like domain-containing protein [Candidatus Eisenbacteria bacterium]